MQLCSLWMHGAMTDLRIGQIGHGLGPRATLLTKNLRNCAVGSGITSQFTLKRVEMQMSTLDSWQCSNNTTILCIWAWERFRPSVWKKLQKKKEKKETVLFMFNYPLTKSSQQRKTAKHCKTPMKSNCQFWILRWVVFTRFPTEIACWNSIC